MMLARGTGKTIARVAMVLSVPLVLQACTSSQSATSSYGGAGFDREAVKTAKTSTERKGKLVRVTRKVPERDGGGTVTTMAYVPENAATPAAAAADQVAKPQAAPVRTAALGTDSTFIETSALNREKEEFAAIPAAGPVRKPTKRPKNRLAALPGVKVTTRKSTKIATAPIVPAMKLGGSAGQRKARYAKLIRKHARAHGVPVRLAMAVVQVESMYRPNARGKAGEVGLMQILPQTARFIGYKGPMKKLYDPDTNIRYGMKYLGKAHKLGGGSTCGTILKYNAGHGAKKMNAVSREYCRRIARIMKTTG